MPCKLLILILAVTGSALLPLAVSAQTVQEYCGTAYGLYKQHRGKEAGALLEQALRLNPNFADTYYIRGIIRFHSYDQLTDAKLDLDKAIGLNPQFAVAYAERAMLQYQQKHFAEALADFTEAIKLRPEVSSNYESRAMVYFSLAKYEDAIRDLSHALELNPNSPGLYYSQGLAFIRLKKWDQALPDLDKAIAMEPDAEKYFSRAWVHYKMNNYPKALADYDKAIAAKPDNWMAYQTRGFIYEMQKQYDLGIVQLNTSLQQHPGDANSLEGRGACYEKLAQYDKAIADYTAALKGKPEFRARVFVRRGIVYKIKGEDERAIEDFDAALKLDSKDREALLMRARCYRALGAYGDALADYAALLRINPKDRDALMERAKCSMEFDADDKALADYTSIVEHAPQDGRALAARAELYFNRSELDSAIEDETKIVQQYPNAANAWRRRGYYRLWNGELRDALADHNTAVLLAPGDSYILLSRVLVNTAMGNYSEAIADCDEVLKREGGKTGGQSSRNLAWASARKFKAVSLMGQSATAAEQLQNILSSQREILLKSGELKSAEESYRMARHLEAAVAKAKAETTPEGESAEKPVDEIDKSFANRLATKHFLVMSDESQERVIYYAQFAEAFRTYVDKNLIKAPDGSPVRIYLFTNREKLVDFARAHQLSGISYDSAYWPARDAILTHGRQSFAPLALQIVDRAVKMGVPEAEPWARSGIPDLFTKFYGYFDGPNLVTYYGYQTYSADLALSSDSAALKLSDVVAMKDPKPLDPRARLLAVFLQVNQKLQEYLRLTKAGDTGQFKTSVEAAFGASVADLEPMWSAYLCRTARNIKDWERLPASEIFEGKSELTKFMKEKHVPMPDESVHPERAPDGKPVAQIRSRCGPAVAMMGETVFTPE